MQFSLKGFFRHDLTDQFVRMQVDILLSQRAVVALGFVVCFPEILEVNFLYKITHTDIQVL